MRYGGAVLRFDVEADKFGLKFVGNIQLLTSSNEMERRSIQYRVRLSPANPPPRNGSNLNNRGQIVPLNHHDNSYSGDRPPIVPKVQFVRNPMHPKNLFSTEISMRKAVRGKELKLTPGLSFPDPKKPKTISNPNAPRFRHDYDLTEEDFNFTRNPLPIAAQCRDAGQYPDDDDDSDESDYDRGENYNVISDSSDDDVDTPLPVQGDDLIDIESALEEPREEMAQYSNVNRLRGHLVRGTPPLTAASPPVFEPQPPPPKALVNPVLVIPRAMIRDRENYLHQRLLLQRRNPNNDEV